MWTFTYELALDRMKPLTKGINRDDLAAGHMNEASKQHHLVAAPKSVAYTSADPTDGLLRCLLALCYGVRVVPDLSLWVGRRRDGASYALLHRQGRHGSTARSSADGISLHRMTDR